MRLALLVTLFYISTDLHGQDLTVTYSRNAFFANGQKIKSEDVIAPGTRVNVGRNGKLSIDYKRWSLRFFEKGNYSIDSALRLEFMNPKFRRHDSVYTILESKGLLTCKSSYESTSGSRSCETTDQIKIRNEHDTLVKSSSSVVIEWDHPTSYASYYYLVVTNIFDEYLAVIRTKDTRVDIDPSEFKPETAVLYEVIAEDCRESNIHTLRLE